MDQRVFRGNVTPEGMADYLVARFQGNDETQVQKVGQGASFLVQIQYGDEDHVPPLTVAIADAAPSGQGPGVMVTLGQQQWITPELAKHGLVLGLLSLLATPWVLFGLLWTVPEVIASRGLPKTIWNHVEMYAASQGAVEVPVDTGAHAKPTPLPEL
jgi:hypothetical protein